MKKFLKIFFRILVSAAGVYLAALAYVVVFSISNNLPKHADAALILGAKVYLNNTPSEPLYNRTVEASKLYNQGVVDYIIATGGQGLGYVAESRLSSKIAEQQGVPKDKILTETESHDTYENIRDIQKIAQAKGVKSIVIVSDRFHLARSVLVAKHFGFGPVYWDAPSLSYFKTGDIIWEYLRESAALLYYIPKVFLSPSQA